MKTATSPPTTSETPITASGRFISIKTKLLLGVFGIFVVITLLNVGLASYLTHKHNQEEADRWLSLQVSAFGKQLEELQANFRRTALETAKDSRNIGDFALSYDQSATSGANSSDHTLRVTLRFLESIIRSSGISGVGVYLDTHLSHYVTTDEAGVMVHEADTTTLHNHWPATDGTFDFTARQTWDEHPLTPMLTRTIELPDTPTHRLVFHPELGAMFRMIIPLQGKLVESLGMTTVTDIQIATPEASAAEHAREEETQIIGACVFLQVLNFDLLHDQAETTGILPALYAADGSGGRVHVKAMQEIEPRIDALLHTSEAEAAAERFDTTVSTDGVPYYQKLRRWQFQNGQEVILGAALSQETTRAQVRETVRWLILAAAAILLIVSLAGYLLIAHLIEPVNVLSRAAQKMARGIFDIHVPYTSHDELGQLSRAFYTMVTYLWNMANTADNISRGQVNQTVRPRSQHDTLGNAFSRMTGYLHNIAEVTTGIADGDLTREVPLQSDADVFSQAIRTMTTGLSSLIRQIRQSAHDIALTGSSIVLLAEQDMQLVQTVQTSTEKMVSTMNAMGLSVEEVAQNMESLSSAVEQTSSAIEEMTARISQIAANSTTLAQHTEQATVTLDTTVHQLDTVAAESEKSEDLAQETIRQAVEGQQVVEQLNSSMETIQQANQDAVATMTRFEHLSGDIGTILDVIRGITDQTNLLALNASIIAAQAGSHGKGFAVIAEEIKNLAAQVEESTKGIAEIVQTVRQETSNVVRMIRSGTDEINQGVQQTQHAQQMLQKIMTSAERSSTMVSDIVAALDMQRSTGHEMMDTMQRLHELTGMIMIATHNQKNGAVQINEAAQYILTMASQTKDATVSQLDGVNEVVEAAYEVKTLSDQNLQSSQHINQVTTGELVTQARLLLESVDRFRLSDTDTENASLPATNNEER
jgi:methyl-accepting chemotaxis protein